MPIRSFDEAFGNSSNTPRKHHRPITTKPPITGRKRGREEEDTNWQLMIRAAEQRRVEPEQRRVEAEQRRLQIRKERAALAARAAEARRGIQLKF